MIAAQLTSETSEHTLLTRHVLIASVYPGQQGVGRLVREQ